MRQVSSGRKIPISIKNCSFRISDDLVLFVNLAKSSCTRASYWNMPQCVDTYMVCRCVFIHIIFQSKAILKVFSFTLVESRVLVSAGATGAVHPSILGKGCMHPSIFRPDTSFRLFCLIYPVNGQILRLLTEITSQGTVFKMFKHGM